MLPALTPPTPIPAPVPPLSQSLGRGSPVFAFTSSSAPTGDASLAVGGSSVLSPSDERAIAAARELLRQTSVLQLRAELKSLAEEDPTVSINTVVDVILQQRITEDRAEADALVDAMQSCGILFRHGDIVYLRPKELAEQVMSLLPGSHVDMSAIERKMEATLADLEPLEAELSEARGRAESRAKRMLALFTTGLGVQMYGLYWLIFEELSWDVMEPAAYFYGLGIGIAGYVYSLLVGRDYTYETMWGRMTAKYLSRELTRRGFPRIKYDMLLERLEVLDRRARISQLIPSTISGRGPVSVTVLPGGSPAGTGGKDASKGVLADGASDEAPASSKSTSETPSQKASRILRGAHLSGRMHPRARRALEFAEQTELRFAAVPRLQMAPVPLDDDGIQASTNRRNI